MSLSPEQLDDARQLVREAGSLREVVAAWRSRHPDIRALLLDPADLREETPVLAIGARRVYLAASNGHCWTITQRPDEAQAVILTQDES